MKRNRVLLLLFILLLLVAVACGCHIWRDLHAREKEQQVFEKLEKTVALPEPTAQPEEDTAEAPQESQPPVSHDFDTLATNNVDCIGWLSIPDTVVSYPVMYAPSEPERYLHLDFYGHYSYSGTPFLDANSVVFRWTSADGYAINVTWNWLIYGHNMNFGTMFHDLQEYDSVEFWQEHPTFTFDVYNPSTGVTDNAEYEIFAVSRSKIQTSDSDAFAYYQYAGYTDKETFNEYVAGVKAESSYDTGIVPQFGDQLVTLSTCAYHVDEGRFYICGRRIK